MKSRNLLVALLVLLLPAIAFAGQNHFLNADLGNVGIEKADLDGAMNRIMADNFKASGEFEAVRTNRSPLGTHVRFQQHLNGMPVFGAQMILHLDADGNAYSVNGDFGAASGVVAPKVDGPAAMAMALGKAGIPTKAMARVDLGYVLVDGAAVLAWYSEVEYRNEVGPQRDIVFAGAADGELVARHPQIHYARLLETRDCHNATNQCTGDIVSNSSNPINTGDLAIDSAHNFAIDTYDLYNARYGRDGINGSGMEMISRVHFDSNYNNAFWDGTKMTYGDGDGTTFVPLSQDADVVAHELTHGVTSNESNLIYSNESGALNESLSDVFGSEVDRDNGASAQDTWLIGEDIYTPGTPGDGLRDMADPAGAGDYDCYPTRYTGSQDNGGVHWNSGISNLAYKLLVDGGTHPRSCSSSSVTGIGNLQAARIFYEANANCLTASSNFEAMRNCTASKALALYGSGAEAAVHEAWDAVQVPGGPGGPPPPPPPPPGSLCSDTNIWTGTFASGNLVTPNCSASGPFNGTLQCTGAQVDLDLYLEKQSCGWGCTWNQVAVSGSASCDEQITGAAGSSGTYRWRIHNYQGANTTMRLCTNKC